MTRLGHMMQAHGTVPRLAARRKTSAAEAQAEATLTRAALWQVPPGRGLRIECLSGRAWITVDGRLQDIVLDRGEMLTLGPHASVFISGLPEASVRVAKR